MPAAEQLITDYLDLWTAAIKRKSTAGRGSSSKVELYGINKVRELILELAVRGLLVPQDPKDEPASELLRKIAAEKAKLVKEGKINKEKPLPPVGDDEKSFGVPAGWEWSRLQDVSEYIQRGKGPIYAESGRVRVVSQKCIQWRGFDVAASRFVDDASLSGYKDERYLKNQDLLWNSTGTGTVGRANVLEQVPEKGLVADSHVTVVRTLDVNSKYFCIYVSSPGVQARIEPTHEASLVSGSTQQVELNTSSVVVLPVPVPPLDEQHSIVARVDKLMALCDQLEQQTEASRVAHQTLVENLLNALTSVADHAQFAGSWQRIAAHFDTLFTTEESIGQLKQTILQLAVMGKLVHEDRTEEPASELLKKIAAERAKLMKEGKIKADKVLPAIEDAEKPYDLPKGWAWEWLPNISYFQEGPGIMAKDFRSQGVPLIRISGVHGALVTLHGCNFLEEDMVAKKWNHFRLDLNDIILSSSASLGKVSKVGSDTVGCIAYTGLIRFKPFKSVFDEYLIRFLGSSEFARQIDDSKRGAAILHFGPTHLRGMIVPVPPLAEQQRIVAKVDALMALADRLKSRLIDAQTTQLNLADALAEQALAEA